MASASSGPNVAPEATPTSRQPFRHGWTAFAVVLMIFGGAMAIFEGIAAITKDNVFVATRNYVFQFSLTGWGWIHLVLGIVIVLVGFALFTGALWARVVGIVFAGLAALAHFLWLPFYPFWSIVLIAINVFILWALCAAPLEEEEA
ncbi:DUF7144 family membrane protein [Streptomyces sp. NBC_01217]|uniref:DUF7144 family membrane protein n=1 Tax=Streptomyces sp. NBC_01217 TaxID=2903779 RepID=UPI002E104BBF|nr:hypothetical protein OG507_05540 [Streptomyces sp. NBC_01217]